MRQVGANDDIFICHLVDKRLLLGFVITVANQSLRGHFNAHGDCFVPFNTPVGTPCEFPFDCGN